MTVFSGYSAFRFAYLISISTALPSNWNSIRPESHHPRAALPEIFSSRDWRANEAAQISPDQIAPQAPTPLGHVSRFVQPAALPWRYLHQWTPHAVHDGRSRHRPAARALHPAVGGTRQAEPPMFFHPSARPTGWRRQTIPRWPKGSCHASSSGVDLKALGRSPPTPPEAPAPAGPPRPRAARGGLR